MADTSYPTQQTKHRAARNDLNERSERPQPDPAHDGFHDDQSRSLLHRRRPMLSTRIPDRDDGVQDQHTNSAHVTATKSISLVVYIFRTLLVAFNQALTFTSLLIPVVLTFLLLIFAYHILSLGTSAVASWVSTISRLVDKLSDLSHWIACVTIGSGCVIAPDPLATIINITSSSTAELQQSYNMVGTLSMLSESSHIMMINSVADSNLLS